MDKMKKLDPSRLTRVTGGSGYNGEKKCPVCNGLTMMYMPSILTPDGVSYAVYRCSNPNCGNEERIPQ